MVIPSPHKGSKGYTVQQQVADPYAIAQTRNGSVDMGAVEFQMSYDADKVSIEFISRKRGVQLNAGCRGILPDEMDKLCRAWLKQREGYYVEHNGDCWQSVFPSSEAELSQLHVTASDAVAYIHEQRPDVPITVLPKGGK